MPSSGGTGEAIDLGTLAWRNEELCRGINDSGTIVGEGNVSGDGFWRAVMWTVDGGSKYDPNRHATSQVDQNSRG